MEHSERTRLVAWSDPQPALESVKQMTGVEWLSAMRDGNLPRSPISALIGYDITEFGDGRAVIEVEAGEWLFNPLGSVHGGVLTLLLDSAMGCAVHTLLPRGAGYSTLEIKLNFIHSLRKKGEKIKAQAEVIHLGSKIATVDGKILDGEGALACHGLATFFLFPPKAPDKRA